MTATAQQLRDRIKEEYKKCAVSPDYFLTKYSYIQHPVRGRMLFDLYDYQKQALTDFEKENYNIILKGRQIGISTLVAGYALWLLLFHNDKNILVIATKQETAKNLVTKVRFMHQNLPVWLRGSVITDNKLSLQFANGSQIKAVASSKDAGRSEALSLLIIDECVGPETTISVRNKTTGEIKNIPISEFYDMI
jgi:phage terminase large subunit-like protein